MEIELELASDRKPRALRRVCSLSEIMQLAIGYQIGFTPSLSCLAMFLWFVQNCADLHVNRPAKLWIHANSCCILSEREKPPLF